MNAPITYQLSGITVLESSTDTSWRLIYNDTEVIILFESNGMTITPEKYMFCALTKQECLDKISELNLIYVDRYQNLMNI